jgi:methionyl-tRNA synthetase
MDIRTGTILKPKKCRKQTSLILKVDTGIDVRTIVSGIAESFKPEDIGKKSYCFSEFGSKKPSRRRSQGMILMTTNAEGKLVL